MLEAETLHHGGRRTQVQRAQRRGVGLQQVRLEPSEPWQQELVALLPLLEKEGVELSWQQEVVGPWQQLQRLPDQAKLTNKRSCNMTGTTKPA